MNEKVVEKLMNHYKQELVVNEEFKRRLRKSFETEKERKSSRWVRQYSVLGMVASLLFVVYTFSDAGVNRVNASSLTIGGQLSFAEVGFGKTVSMAEYEETLYLSLKEKGIYEYTK